MCLSNSQNKLNNNNSSINNTNNYIMSKNISGLPESSRCYDTSQCINGSLCGRLYSF